MALTPGTRLGAYEIVAAIGAGGMGEVYRARDTRLGRDVALKVLPAGVAPDVDRLDRFQREARASAALNHPNIVVTYDIGKADGVVYVVMELLAGATLREELTAHPPTTKKALDWAMDVARGLASAHAKGIVHRDIKPENLFVTSDGRVKILDFGIARFTAAEANATESATVAAGTEPGMVMGTAGYMSPEQVRGEPIDARSDIFSLGAVLYEMLAGKRAFSGDTAIETMHAVLKADPPEFSEAGVADVPPALERVVRRCLEKRSEDRFYSAHDLALTLDAVNGSRTQPGAAVPGTARPPRRVPLAIAAILLVVAGALGAWLLTRNAPTAFPTIRQVTFRRGAIDAARYSAAGEAVVYSARFAGASLPSPFETRLNSPEARQVGPANAVLFAASDGALALGLQPRIVTGRYSATLAALAPGAEAARALAPFVISADFVSGGFAATDYDGNRGRVHFPLGTIVHESQSQLINLRTAPGGAAIAFMGREGIVVVHADGAKQTIAAERASGLAWAPDGKRLWFSSIGDGADSTLWSVVPGGQPRAEWRMPGVIVLEDIASDGRVLVKRDDAQFGTLVIRPGASEPEDVAWLDRSMAAAVAAGSGDVLLTDTGGVYLRKPGGSPAVRLGDGRAHAISPDGLHVLTSSTPDRFELVPTGAGASRRLTHPGIESYFAWFHPDGRRVVFNGRTKDGTWRHYMMDIDGTGGVTPVGLDNLEHAAGQEPLSNDGNWLAGFPLPSRDHVVVSLDGRESIPVIGKEPNEVLIRFAQGDRELFVYNRETVPARVFRLNFRTGERQLWRELRIGDPAGVVGIPTIAMTADGQTMAFNYRKVLSTVYEITGLGGR